MITDRRRMDVDGHDVEFRFFIFDRAQGTWTRERRTEVDAAVERLEAKQDLRSAERRELEKLYTERRAMTGPAYERDVDGGHDYGWMVTIDGTQRMGVFPLFSDADEYAREMIADADSVLEDIG